MDSTILVSNYLGICKRSRGHFIAKTVQYTLECIEIHFPPTIPQKFSGRYPTKKKILLKIFEKDVAIKKVASK